MSSTHPRGIPFIIVNEIAERFSYYGMKSILVVFMTTMLLDSAGTSAPMSKEDATFWYHIFGMGNYFVPIFGAVIADTVWGKYRTIILLSLVYCAGHAALAFNDTRAGLLLGLSLIAVGSGGIKPCVSAHLGDQYRNHSSGRLSEGFSLFYLGINVGAFVATLLMPWLLGRYGPRVAFGVPGIFMALATLVFWLGRGRYCALPPTPWKRYRSEVFNPVNVKRLKGLAILFLLLSTFWALFDQTGSSWVFQAERMDRTMHLPLGLSFTVIPSQVQAFNPVLILLLTPLCTWGLYPLLARRVEVTTERKLLVGLLLAGASFAIVSYAQACIVAGETVSIGWQLFAYLLLTMAEVMVSITSLEVAYTRAPQITAALTTSFFLLSIALGNGVTALVTKLLSLIGWGPEAVMYFVSFALLPFGSALLIWLSFRRLIEGESSAP
jgi:POT family proton-dependent oligopeptide transporter